MTELTGAAAVVGLIGRPVAHSLSPRMHNRAFAHLGMDWVYVPFEVADDAVSAALAGVKALSIRGVNVTVPHKTAVIPFLDELTPEAAAMGAVNTIVNDSGRLVGHNTDGSGFVRSLREVAGFDPHGARVLVLGAGGAARAVAIALARAGAERVAVANRTESKARRLAEDVARHGASSAGLSLAREPLAAELRAADAVVQTTSVGMAGDPSLPLDPDLLAPRHLVADIEKLRDMVLSGEIVRVADIVYTPLKTPLLRAAEARGCRTLPGWGMLLYQGVEAFECWTGTPAPANVMREALLEALRGKEAEA